MLYQKKVFLMILLISLKCAMTKQTRIGDECCFEDWDREVGKPFKDTKDLTTPAFLTAFTKYESLLKKYVIEKEPEGICHGRLSFKCNANTKRCECNDVSPVFKYEAEDKNCLGGIGTFCLQGLGAVGCKKGFICVKNTAVANGRIEHCQTNPASQLGEDEKSNGFKNYVQPTVMLYMLLVYLCLG